MALKTMSLKIGELAKRSGANVQTIRFYEREKLLPTSPRLPSGYRTFPETMVRRVQFIQRAQALGFSLAEIRELLSMRLDPQRGCADVQQLARAKIAHIEEKVSTLQAMKRVLGELAEACPGQGSSRECPILESMDAEASGGGANDES